MAKSMLALLTLPFCFLLSCSSSPTKSALVDSQTKPASHSAVSRPEGEGPFPPEIVRCERVTVENGVKRLTVGDAQGHYLLSCDTSQKSCITPTPGKDYLLFTKTTRWKFPGGEEFATLEFLQDFSISYKDAENIALIPAEQRSPIGMYGLLSWENNK
jgi:hypothetical protein